MGTSRCRSRIRNRTSTGSECGNGQTWKDSELIWQSTTELTCSHLTAPFVRMGTLIRTGGNHTPISHPSQQAVSSGSRAGPAHAYSPENHFIPAKAGIHCVPDEHRAPAFAGVTTQVIFIPFGWAAGPCTLRRTFLTKIDRKFIDARSPGQYGTAGELWGSRISWQREL